MGKGRICAESHRLRCVGKADAIGREQFLGSGTSLIAAEREGRRFRGLDIDPAYVDLAVERWVAMTGKEAVLVVEPITGRTGWTNGWVAA